jgi:hypothetical protein
MEHRPAARVDTKPTAPVTPLLPFGFSPYVINVLWILTVLNRTAAITCQARPDIEIRHDPTTQILAISLKKRFLSSGSESGGGFSLAGFFALFRTSHYQNQPKGGKGKENHESQYVS